METSVITTVISTEKVKLSNWVTVEVVGKEVVFENKPGHDNVILHFQNSEIFDPPCHILHLTKPENVRLRAAFGESLYDVFEPEKKDRHPIVKSRHGRGNCTCYSPEPSNPSGPIIVR